MAKSAQKIKAFTDSEYGGRRGRKKPRATAAYKARARRLEKQRLHYDRKTKTIQTILRKRREDFHQKESDLWS